MNSFFKIKLAVLVLLLGGHASAQTHQYVLSNIDQVEATIFGRDWGSTYTFSCPSGQTISPIDTYYETYVNGLEIGCSALRPNGGMGGAIDWQGELGYPDQFGRATGSSSWLDCFPYLMRDLSGRTGAWVDQIGLGCGSVSEVLAGTDLGEAPDQGPFGGLGGSPFTRQCPDEYIATGAEITVKSDGNYIQGVKMTCSKVVPTDDLEMALRHGEIIGRLCVNEVYDCPYANGFDQYLKLSTLHLEPNSHWWQAFEFWRSPDMTEFDSRCLTKSGTEVDCFDGDTPRDSSLVQEGWYQGINAGGSHHIVGIANDRAWTFRLPHHSNSGSPTRVRGVSFNEECFNGMINIDQCPEQDFDLDEITPIAPVVTVHGQEYLVNGCRYELAPEHLRNTSLSVDTIVQNPDQYFTLSCHSSEENLESLALSGTSAQHLKDIFTVNEILVEANMLTGSAVLGGLGMAAEAAEAGTKTRAMLLTAYSGLRGYFAVGNVAGFWQAAKTFAECGNAACRLEATAQMLMSGYFLKQDVGDLYKFGTGGGLSSMLDEFGINNTELETFLDEELEPLLESTDTERWKYADCNG